MRHRYGNKKMGKPTDQRLALLRSLTRALVLNGKIDTTLLRAKELSKFVDRLITRGKNGSLHNRRLALSAVGGDNAVVSPLFSSLASQFSDRPGGYTRITKLGFRRGDGATLARIELLG